MASFVLKNGYKLVAKSDVNIGITNNCGMQTITNISVYCMNASGFSDQFLKGNELFACINQHWDWVFASITKEIIRGLVVISDVVLLEGNRNNNSHKFDTADFIRELVNRGLGVVTLSPLIRNRSYHEGRHDIQACIWTPPQMQHEIVVPASIHVGECTKPVVEYAQAHKEVYDEWRSSVVPSEHKEEWEAAPVVEPTTNGSNFFKDGQRVEELREVYVRNRDNPQPVAPSAGRVLDALGRTANASVLVAAASGLEVREYAAPTAAAELAVRQTKRKRAKK